MNRDYVLYNLREARDELQRTIDEIETDLSYDHGELHVAALHVYHHVNTAWNARDATRARTDACTSSDFALWRQFPNDLDMSA